MMQFPHENTAGRSTGIKANFDRIYSEPDPREYYRVLGGLDYVIPDLASGIFHSLITALERLHGRAIRVLDLGCSYGNNAALIRYPLTFGALQQRYSNLQGAGVTTSELIALDKSFFSSWPRHDVEIIGCDVSRPAAEYARSVGLIDAAITSNLENEPLLTAGRNLLRGVDLIISTGAIGYVTERTLRRLCSAIGEPVPWVASFVLRMFPYDNIAALMTDFGNATEKLEGVTFVQRRFQSEQEFTRVLTRLSALGIDPSQKEAEGLLHAEFFLSRPPRHCLEIPIEELASVTSGAGLPFGRRFRLGADNVVRLGL